jgi:hypothetical protein
VGILVILELADLAEFRASLVSLASQGSVVLVDLAGSLDILGIAVSADLVEFRDSLVSVASVASLDILVTQVEQVLQAVLVQRVQRAEQVAVDLADTVV